MFRANAIYEGEYLLGTSIARPLIAKKQIEIFVKKATILLFVNAIKDTLIAINKIV